MFIAHLLHSKKDETVPQVLQLNGNHLNYIEVIGIVVREKRREEQCSENGMFSRIDYFTIDDGTGLLDCKIQNKALRECMQVDENVQ